MASLTFYGGINEIGGNKILLEDQDTRIFLDFGMSFSKSGKYYAEFLQPRTCNGIGDLMELGIIPDIDGIYRDDLLANEGRKLTEVPGIDGVLLSHPHADHIWHISLLHKDTPIYCGEAAKTIMQATQETSTGMYYMDIYYYRENFKEKWKQKPRYERNINTFRTGDKFKIKNLEIEPIHVDHSIPGAYGFLIHTSEGCVAYTGDLRFHGRRPEMTDDFVKKAEEEKPCVLITEGTRVAKEVKINGKKKIVLEENRGLSEQQVSDRIGKYIDGTKKLAIASFPPRDIDRFITFYEASKDSKREFAITDKQAYMLELLNEQDLRLDIPDIDKFKIYVQKTRWGRFEEWEYKKWQRKYLNYENMVNFEDIKKVPDKYILFCSFFDLHELIDIGPDDGSTFIYSLTEPFNEEMEIDFNRMKNWLDHFKLPIKKAHASGHACGTDLKEVVNQIKPNKLFPVHTEHPEMFKEMYKGKVVLPKLDQTYNI